MRNLGALEIGLILLVVVLIFGAGKLPQLGRAVGDTIKEFKKSMKPSDDEAKTEEKSADKNGEKKS